MSSDQLVPSHMESIQPTNSTTQQEEVPMDLWSYNAARQGYIGQLRGYGNRLDLEVNASKNSILHIYLMETASRGGEKSIQFVKKALQMCPSLVWTVDAANLDTPLHVAARNNSGLPEIVRMLIDTAKAHPEDTESGEGGARQLLKKTNENGDTALHEAARNNHLEMVKILTGEDPELEYFPNGMGETPIYLSVEGGWTHIVDEILKTCSSVAYDGPGGKTALHAAVLSNDEEMVGVLLEKDISLANKTDDYGWTPLHYAAYNSFHGTNMVIQLLQVDSSAAYVTDRDRKMTALHVAASRGYQRRVLHIISRCPGCFRITDSKGWNVFHHLAASGNVKALEDLIGKYEDPSRFLFLLNQKDVKGYTPLHILAAIGYRDLPSIILQKSGVGRHALNKDNRSWNDLFYVSRWIVEYPDEGEVLGHHLTKDIREWIKDTGMGPMGKICGKQQWDLKARVIPRFKEAKDEHLIVSTLIATVTFAAAFTIPGGFKSDASDPERGTAILGRNAAFKTFVIMDTLAMLLSISSVITHFFLAARGYRERHAKLISLCTNSTEMAMVAMVVAFVTGSYAVLAPSLGLAISNLVIGLLIFFFLLVLLKINAEINFNNNARAKCYCNQCQIIEQKSNRVHKTLKLLWFLLSDRELACDPVWDFQVGTRDLQVLN